MFYIKLWVSAMCGILLEFYILFVVLAATIVNLIITN